MIDGAKVRQLRRARGWTQTDLSRVSGLKQTTISDIETGKGGAPKFDQVERLVTALEVDATDLLRPAAAAAVADDPNLPEMLRKAAQILEEQQRQHRSRAVRIPVVNSLVRAGTNGIPEDQVIGEEWGSADLEGRAVIGLVVRGSCMEPHISPGDTVIVEQGAAYVSGDTVVALHEGEELVKYAMYRNGAWWLESEREPPMKVNGGTTVRGKVLRVVGGAPKRRE